MRRALCLALVLGAAGAAGPAAAAAATDPAALVHPLSGTTGSGFPMVGASVPFGMIQPGPDTALANGQQSPVNYDGYAYHDQTIRGFSLTHFDGAGIKIAGDLPFMPTTGPLSGSDPASWASPYEHASEVAQPGYYAATLARYATRVEISATRRAAIMRFSYPPAAQANLLLESSLSITGPGHRSAVQIVGDRELRGYTQPDVGRPLYFTATFDRPFSGYGSLSGGAVTGGARTVSGTDAGAYVSFDTSAVRTVTMRVAISYVDPAGADGNLAAELPPQRSFDAVRTAAHDAWNAQLRRAAVSGGDAGMRATYYTNLYRALLMPSIYDDADGRYVGFDQAVHTVAPGTHHYTNLSSWDTYRTQTPLLELIDPHVAHDLAISLLDDYDQDGGFIPRWTQSNNERSIMGGDSGAATVAELAVNGALSSAEVSRAYAALAHQATTLPPVSPREHLDQYISHGYVGEDVSDIGAALTLEYAIDDNAVAGVAERAGDAAGASALRARAASWRNLVDPGSQFIRPRNSDGSWANPTRSLGPVPLPTAVPWSPNFQDGYQEGTGWQYLWAVPHDVAGLAQAIGSRDAALQRLDTFFSTPLNQPLVSAVPVAQQYVSFFGVYYIGNQFTPANEPDLWAPWYYDWLGKPASTQQIVRAEMGVYNTRPDGMPGNDDTGTMSAWYVLAALGLYHAAPGTSVWELNSPAFARERLALGGGRALTVSGAGAGAAQPYVQAARLGGATLGRTYLTTCELERSRTLSFSLAATPSNWGTGAGAAPPSLSDAAVPGPVRACVTGGGS